MWPILQLMRPHQYLKNGFVLVGAIFSHDWGPSTFLSAGLIFIAFCLAASAVYVLNDLIDLAADRAHPLKRNRPLASGRVSARTARLLYVCLLIPALWLSFWVSAWAGGCIVAYLVINLLYSNGLKHVVILDVFTISSGFMLRILAGTLGLAIAPSAWLLLCGLMLTLFLGFAKRRAELFLLEDAEPSNAAPTRRVLEHYTPVVLDQLIAVTAACTVLAYGLYTVSPQTIALHGNDALIYTLPFVIYGIFRYMFMLQRSRGGNDAARDLLTDPHLLLTMAGWLAATLWILA